MLRFRVGFLRTAAVVGCALAAAGPACSSAPPTATPSLDSVSDLSLHEVLPSGTVVAGSYAVFLSGDGGWADLDRTIAGALADHGIRVVGWNLMRYFLWTGSPERSAADLGRILRLYHGRWAGAAPVLIGYSRGADVLPFMVNRLPADLGAGLRAIALLAPGLDADFAGATLHWIGPGNSRKPVPLEPEITRLKGRTLLGFYGAEEEHETACVTAAGAFTRVLQLPGDHHFGASSRNHAAYLAITDELLTLFR